MYVAILRKDPNEYFVLTGFTCCGLQKSQLESLSDKIIKITCNELK